MTFPATRLYSENPAILLGACFGAQRRLRTSLLISEAAERGLGSAYPMSPCTSSLPKEQVKRRIGLHTRISSPSEMPGLPCFLWEIRTGKNVSPWCWRTGAGGRSLMLIESDAFEIDELENETLNMAVLPIRGTAKRRRGVKGFSFLKNSSWLH